MWTAGIKAARRPVCKLTQQAVFYNSYPTFDDENNLSMAVFLRCHTTGVMFTGDLEKAGFAELLKRHDFRDALRGTQWQSMNFGTNMASLRTTLGIQMSCRRFRGPQRQAHGKPGWHDRSHSDHGCCGHMSTSWFECGTREIRTDANFADLALATRPRSVIEPNLRFASPENGNNAEHGRRLSGQRAENLSNSGRRDPARSATSPPTAGFPATL
jgi:hypothetical protein